MNFELEQAFAELNDVRKLTVSEIKAADIFPLLPEGRGLAKTKCGVCDCCGYWNSDLYQGACERCNDIHGLQL